MKLPLRAPSSPINRHLSIERLQAQTRASPPQIGYRRLIFHIPQKLLDPRAFEAYLDDEFICLETPGTYHLLELTCNEMDDFEYLHSGDTLNRLSTLREQIIEGDFRALHIA